jgi:predicted XRE-type DNA-binding protein
MNERPDIKRIKSELAAAIVGLIDGRKLTDMAASERLTLAPTEIARLRSGDLTGFAVDHMISVLNAFDLRIDVKISPDTTVGATTTPEAMGRRPARNPLLSIVQYMQELNAKIPAEELERLPTDLAANHDHYLYGTPKRE